jgi:peptidoglycan/xylan/chitin deacetylase (PgdA/CDA1 family)
MKSKLLGPLKTMLGSALYATAWPRHYFRDKYLITAFHRVNNHTVGDGITCTPDRFRELCIWLAKNFDVVPLEAQIAALEDGRILPGSASITFDDGYLDNHEIAAPLLRELGLPATFFVATRLIGSDSVTPADARRGIKTEWMNWDHLRDLVSQGFSVESHTSTHQDLGKATPGEARVELVESMTHLKERLGTQKGMFAHPFGGRQHMTDEIRKLVRAVGYRCCVSCHGGVNGLETNPYSLSRMPFNERYESAHQYGLDVLRAAVSREAI